MKGYEKRVKNREALSEKKREYTYADGEVIIIKNSTWISRAEDGQHIVWDAYGVERWCPANWIRLEVWR